MSTVLHPTFYSTVTYFLMGFLYFSWWAKVIILKYFLIKKSACCNSLMVAGIIAYHTILRSYTFFNVNTVWNCHNCVTFRHLFQHIYRLFKVTWNTFWHLKWVRVGGRGFLVGLSGDVPGISKSASWYNNDPFSTKTGVNMEHIFKIF